ncbi:hypothetical protein F4604DRAFT_1690089 [Suillus subluteus]|nr:hypothetical protein F4604DRAFT_1690089 [Suillus subluteus]
MQLLLPGPTPESFSNDHNDDNSSLPPVDPLAYQSQPFSDQRQQWDYAQNHNDWEALLRLTSTWSPYNHDVPGDHSFADPNFSFDSNSYTSSQGPEPSTSYSESDSVTHQAPSGMLGSQTVADSFSADPYQGQLLQQQWDAQSRDDLEALVLRSPSTCQWSPPYNVPGNHSFSGTQHLVLADPNSFYTDSYTSPRGPEPSTSYSESDSVTHQAPSGMSFSQTVEPPAADSFTGVEINARLSVSRLNANLPLHQFDPYRKSDRNVRHRDNLVITSCSAIQTTSSSIPSDSNMDVAPGPSRSVTITLPSDSNLDVGPSPSRSATVTPVPPPPRLGLGSLKRLLLESHKHFKCAMFNCDDGFSMHTETLKGQARGSLDAVFGKKNLDLIEWASSGLRACEVDKITQSQKFVRDVIKDCLGSCCETLYGVWNAFSEMSEQNFIAFIADLLTGEEYLNGPIQVEGVIRNIPFGHVGVSTSARQLLYSGLRYEQYISPNLNLKPLLTFVGLVIAWVLSQHQTGTFVKLGFAFSDERTKLHDRLQKTFEKLTPAELKALTIHIFTKRGVPPNI